MPPCDPKALIADYQSGMYQAAAVAAKHGISRARLYQILAAHGVPKQHRQVTRKPLEEGGVDVKAVAQFYRVPHTFQETAAYFSIGAARLRRILRSQGVSVSQRRVTDEQAATFRAMRGEGKSYAAISDDTGFSLSTVRRYLANVPKGSKDKAVRGRAPS